MLSWSVALTALGLTTALALAEVVARYRDYPLRSQIVSRSNWSLVLIYALLSGLCAALVAAIITGSKSVSLSHTSTQAGIVILSAVTAFGILRMGLAGAKAEPAIGSASAIAGTEAAVGVMRSLLSFLLIKIDQSAHRCYMNYLTVNANAMLSQWPFSFGEKSGSLVSYCGALAGLTEDDSLEGSPKMKRFRDDVRNLGDKGFTDSQKSHLLLRYCIHHAGEDATLEAIKKL